MESKALSCPVKCDSDKNARLFGTTDHLSETESMSPRRLDFQESDPEAGPSTSKRSSRQPSGSHHPSPPKRAKFSFDITSESEEEGMTPLAPSPPTHQLIVRNPAPPPAPLTTGKAVREEKGFLIRQRRLQKRRNESGELVSRGEDRVAIRGQRLFNDEPVAGPSKPKLDLSGCVAASSPLSRRRSEPLPQAGARVRVDDVLSRSFTAQMPVRVNTVANINPFTPHTAFYRNKELVPEQMARLAGSASFQDPFSTPQVNRSNASIDSTASTTSAVTGIDPGVLTRSLKVLQNTKKKDDDDDEDANFSLSTRQRSARSPRVKKLKLSDINMPRYEQEFKEVCPLSCGSFGTVMAARNILDGVMYAIKIGKKFPKGTGQERAAMNEVFAHAALLRNKHLVRYYSSWVEGGKIHIQNELCEGGSLDKIIEERRQLNKHFTEQELRRILFQVSKGLCHIHSQNLVHLDVKPENIFISFDKHKSSPSGAGKSTGEEAELENDAPAQEQLSLSSVAKRKAIEDPATRSVIVKTLDFDALDSDSCDATPLRDDTPAAKRKHTSSHAPTTPRVCPVTPAPPSTPAASTPIGAASRAIAPPTLNTPKAMQKRPHSDSGNASGSDFKKELSKMGGRPYYKIGDLGHVFHLNTPGLPEEGDCRYMAPEMMTSECKKELLPKADIFSLGLSLYECASLQVMPKNSDEGNYVALQAGDIEYFDMYSPQFNKLLKSMVSTDPHTRPSANRLANRSTLMTPTEIKAKLKPATSAAGASAIASPGSLKGKGNKRKKSFSPSGLPAELPTGPLGEESILDFQIKMTQKRLDLLLAQKEKVAKLKEENPEGVAQALLDFYTTTSEEEYFDDLVDTEDSEAARMQEIASAEVKADTPDKADSNPGPSGDPAPGPSK